MYKSIKLFQTPFVEEENKSTPELVRSLGQDVVIPKLVLFQVVVLFSKIHNS